MRSWFEFDQWTVSNLTIESLGQRWPRVHRSMAMCCLGKGKKFSFSPQICQLLLFCHIFNIEDTKNYIFLNKYYTNKLPKTTVSEQCHRRCVEQMTDWKRGKKKDNHGQLDISYLSLSLSLSLSFWVMSHDIHHKVHNTINGPKNTVIALAY